MSDIDTPVREVKKTASEGMQAELEKLMNEKEKEALLVLFSEKDIDRLSALVLLARTTMKVLISTDPLTRGESAFLLRAVAETTMRMYQAERMLAKANRHADLLVASLSEQSTTTFEEDLIDDLIYSDVTPEIYAQRFRESQCADEDSIGMGGTYD